MTDEKIGEGPRLVDEAGEMPLVIDEAVAEEDLVESQRRRSQGSDEDDDTWTNQPAGLESEILEEDLDEEEESEPPPVPRKAIESAKDVVCEELPDRAQRAAARLKPFLTGAFVFEFTNSGERYLFDWRGDNPTTQQLAREISLTCDEAQGYAATESSLNVDTVVSISEAHLMAVRSGSLNPQVGMLTEKIRVKGKVGPAVYIFNVVAPRVRH
jgi:hypothetical protein